MHDRVGRQQVHRPPGALLRLGLGALVALVHRGPAAVHRVAGRPSRPRLGRRRRRLAQRHVDGAVRGQPLHAAGLLLVLLELPLAALARPLRLAEQLVAGVARVAHRPLGLAGAAAHVGVSGGGGDGREAAALVLGLRRAGEAHEVGEEVERPAQLERGRFGGLCNPSSPHPSSRSDLVPGHLSDRYWGLLVPRRRRSPGLSKRVTLR